MAEARVVKFCIHVGYIKSSPKEVTHHRDHPKKGHDYGHMSDTFAFYSP